MKRKVAAMVLSMAVAVSMLAGCGSGSDSGADTAPAADSSVPESEETGPESENVQEETSSGLEGKVVAIHQPAVAPYCEAIVNGATEVLEAQGITVEAKYGDLTSDGQLSDIEDFITLGVDAIIVFPWDSSAIKASLEEAKTAGIPVFVVDNPVEDSDLVVSQVATDNYKAGVANAEAMIEDIGTSGKIVILDTPENNSSLLRANGFVDTLTEKAPDIEIVAQQNYNADQAKAMSIMEDILQKNSDIDAVFVCNEDGAFGAVAALEGRNISGVKVYTVDGSANGCKMVEEGKITGISAQQPFLMGQTAAEQVVAYFSGDTVEASVPLDIYYVTGENAGEWAGY